MPNNQHYCKSESGHVEARLASKRIRNRFYSEACPVAVFSLFSSSRKLVVSEGINPVRKTVTRLIANINSQRTSRSNRQNRKAFCSYARRYIDFR